MGSVQPIATCLTRAAPRYAGDHHPRLPGASPVYGDGKIYVQSEEGTGTVLERDCVYIVPLLEMTALPRRTTATP